MIRGRNFSFLFIGLAFGAALPATAQPQPIGIFGCFFLFRGPGNCYAIAAPADAPPAQGWQPFAAIGHWPQRRTGGQLHIRLSREKRAGSAVLVNVDGQAAGACMPRPHTANEAPG